MKRYKTYSGIYTITNIINNKIYVGSTTFNLSHRKRQHFFKLRKGIHENKLLQNSFNKYGESNFVFEILEECNIDYCLSQEQYWMNMLNVCNRDFGFNISTVAGNTSGFKHSQETKDKLSKLHKGKKLSQTQIELIRKNNSKPKSEEWKLKIGLAQIGKIVSEETKMKMKLAQQERRRKEKI